MSEADDLRSLRARVARLEAALKELLGYVRRDEAQNIFDVDAAMSRALRVFEAPLPESVPRPGTVARAVSHDGSPLGDVRVEESDLAGDVVGPWWSGTLVSTGERLVRLRPCHYAGPSEKT